MPNEAHVRIDEGVKRGARNAHRPPLRAPEHQAGAIPPDLDPDEVIERYLTESTTSQIAYGYGVSRKTLVRWLVQQRPEQWKQVQVIRALCKKEDGDEGLEGACDALSLARARELLRSAQWDLERLDSRNYGQKQEVTIEITGDLGDKLRRARERVIEGQSTLIQQDAVQQTGETVVSQIPQFIPDNK